MGVIYLTHPRHGVKVATTELEAKQDKENGWSECSDPRDLLEKQEPVPAAPVAPTFVSPLVTTGAPVAPVAPAGLPPGLAVGGAATGTVTTAPAGLPVAPADGSDLPPDFPGRLPLIEAGYSTWASVVGKSADELQAIKGIGPATAEAILKVMNS